MMRRILWLSSVLTIVILFCSNERLFSQSGSNVAVRPKIVVGIVVDQMRWDYLYRYSVRYGNGGFKRLLKEGFACENTFINYLPAATAVGHSSIFTGSVPAINGIVGNYWIDNATGERVYCTEDNSIQGVGTNDASGQMSPKNLLSTTITDELRLATNFQSRVVGVSVKDRASILPAGHIANAAFWYDEKSGKFISSTYYMEDLPDWVTSFNNKNLSKKFAAEGWNTLHPIGSYNQSTKDNAPWEGTFVGEKEPTFPHKMDEVYEKTPGEILRTPFGDSITLEFAKEIIMNYELGGDGNTDFLTINCASADKVGHKFGPNSIEEEDTFLRLDRELADFFRFLDNQIGKGQYLLFLTADHGGAHSIDFMKEQRIPADFLDMKEINKSLNEYLDKQFNITELTHFFGYNVYIDQTKLAGKSIDLREVESRVTNFLNRYPGIEFAVNINQIGLLPIPEVLKTKIINGYYAKRTSNIVIVPNPGWFSGKKGNKGNSHGNWNPYDTHIPLIFMGWNIKHGSTVTPTYITDIAPTLASLLHIQTPSGSIGNSIEEVFK